MEGGRGGGGVVGGEGGRGPGVPAARRRVALVHHGRAGDTGIEQLCDFPLPRNRKFPARAQSRISRSRAGAPTCSQKELDWSTISRHLVTSGPRAAATSSSVKPPASTSPSTARTASMLSSTCPPAAPPPRLCPCLCRFRSMDRWLAPLLLHLLPLASPSLPLPRPFPPSLLSLLERAHPLSG